MAVGNGPVFISSKNGSEDGLQDHDRLCEEELYAALVGQAGKSRATRVTVLVLRGRQSLQRRVANAGGLIIAFDGNNVADTC